MLGLEISLGLDSTISFEDYLNGTVLIVRFMTCCGVTLIVVPVTILRHLFWSYVPCCANDVTFMRVGRLVVDPHFFFFASLLLSVPFYLIFLFVLLSPLFPCL